MKLSILQENLARGLGVVGRAVNARWSTLPILGNVLLATDDGRLRLTATNLEVGIHCWVGANVEEQGAITLPAKTLSDLVNALPKERVDLALDTKALKLSISAGRTQANVKGIDAEEFPIVTIPDETSGISVEAGVLREAIQQVAFAASPDESRPILTGVLMKFSGDELTLAAADGYRLSARSIVLSEPVSEPFSVIVPARALSELNRISGEQVEPITVTVTPKRNQILFQLTDIVLASQLIDGNFPDYTRIIPKSKQTTMTVETAKLLKACRTALVFAREAANIVQLHIDPETDRLAVTATSAESGDNTSVLDVQADGEEIEIAFNVEYLIETLRAVETPQVSLELTSPNNPGTVRPVDGSDFTHVIMPMNLD